MAIVSILHRISGVLLFLGAPVMLYFLQRSLHSVTAFDELMVLLNHPFWKLFNWFFLSALLYHLLAGIRHMIMDFGFGETLLASRRSAVLLLALVVVGVLGLGVWIW
jgi:succinate dehydrogenase / fumarate reductase cytochrome b subunit